MLLEEKESPSYQGRNATAGRGSGRNQPVVKNMRVIEKGSVLWKYCLQYLKILPTIWWGKRELLSSRVSTMKATGIEGWWDGTAADFAKVLEGRLRM